MLQIYEASSAELGEVMQFVRENWEELKERPLAKPEEQDYSYWEMMHRRGRIFFSRGEDRSLVALISLSKNDTEITIDLFYIKPPFREQEIGLRLIRFAERAAINWSGEHIKLMFAGKDELERIFPMFQNLGYVFHCPMNQKGTVLLEKSFKK